MAAPTPGETILTVTATVTIRAGEGPEDDVDVKIEADGVQSLVKRIQANVDVKINADGVQSLVKRIQAHDAVLQSAGYVLTEAIYFAIGAQQVGGPVDMLAQRTGRA